MANSVSQVLLTENPLKAAADTAATTEEVRHGESVRRRIDPAAGAVIDFWGVVRQLEDGREIEGIDYEVHQAMAEHQMQLIADAASEQFQLKRILLHHRSGFVRAGEASLFLRVSAQRRAAAFEASKWIVDELKKKVPIWKKPRFVSRTNLEAAHRAAATP
jgi:molybdopterin synthase catalytic subunit